MKRCCPGIFPADLVPLRTEIFHSLYGAFRLLLLDQGGMRWFNVSITGFYRSFLAAVLVATVVATTRKLIFRV